MTQIQCLYCKGDGRKVIGELRVTRDMALDAGDLSLEGSLYDYEYAQCEFCNGNGWIISPFGEEEE